MSLLALLLRTEGDAWDNAKSNLKREARTGMVAGLTLSLITGTFLIAYGFNLILPQALYILGVFGWIVSTGIVLIQISLVHLEAKKYALERQLKLYTVLRQTRDRELFRG